MICEHQKNNSQFSSHTDDKRVTKKKTTKFKLRILFR